MTEFEGGLKEKVMITDRKKFKKIYDLKSETIQLPTGNIKCEELRNMERGSSFFLNGKEYIILDCDLQDYIMKKLTRKTQIVYPKEAGYILFKLDVFPGKTIGETGTGSAALTNVFSRAVGSDGKVYTFEKREDFKKVIFKNLAEAKVFDNVEVIDKALEDSEADINGILFDAFFLDVKEPWSLLEHVYKALKPSGHLGIFLPTTNQIEKTLKALDKEKFYLHEITEIMIRKYKDNPDRIRPEDTMIGHTGFLIFARKLV